MWRLTMRGTANEIGPEGAKVIGDGMAKCADLQSIDLGGMCEPRERIAM